MVMRILPWLPAVLLVLVGSACGNGGSSLGSAFIPSFRLVDVRIDRSTETSAVREALVCCDGGRVIAAWIEEREFDRAIYTARSSNAGASWSAPLRVDDVQFAMAIKRDLRLCCSDGRVHVAWIDDRHGRPDVFYDRSLDGGESFPNADDRIGVGLTGQFAHDDLVMTCTEARVALAFRVVEDGAIYVATGGASVGALGDAVPVDGHSSLSRSPAICLQDSYVYVAWQDARNGQDDIYFTRSVNGGASYASAQRVDQDEEGEATSITPRICCDESRVYVGWVDFRVGRRIWFNRSVDRGASWRNLDQPVDSSPVTPTEIGNFEMHCSGPDLRFAWTDDRTGDLAVWFRRSTNSGLSMSGVEERLSPAGAPDVEFVKMQGDRNRIFVTWSEGTPGLVQLRTSNDRGAGYAAAVTMHASEGLLPSPVLYDFCTDGRIGVTVFRDVRRPGSLDLWSNGTFR